MKEEENNENKEGKERIPFLTKTVKFGPKMAQNRVITLKC